MKYPLGSDEFFESQTFIDDAVKTGRDRIFWSICHVPESPELLALISNLDDVNVCDRNGFSYLHAACLFHQTATVELLLKKGADPNRLDNQGRTSILLALGRKHPNNTAILKAFIDHGLDLDATVNGMTIREHIFSFGNDEYCALIK